MNSKIGNMPLQSISFQIDFIFHLYLCNTLKEIIGSVITFIWPKMIIPAWGIIGSPNVHMVTGYLLKNRSRGAIKNQHYGWVTLYKMLLHKIFQAKQYDLVVNDVFSSCTKFDLASETLNHMLHILFIFC